MIPSLVRSNWNRVLRRLGAVFMLSLGAVGGGTFHAGGGTPVSVYSFKGSGDGAYPQANLLQGTDGFFYGTTQGGGNAHGLDGGGVVFRVATDGTLTILHAFAANGADGYGPAPTLVQGSDGALYGTTDTGGASNVGTVFRITTTGAFTSLYSFTGGKDGAAPVGLALGADGNLYGSAPLAGANGYGTLFRVTPDGTFTALYAFTGGADGASPQAPPTQGSDGNLYGTTAYGGKAAGYAGYGTVFRATTAGALTTLYTFTGGADGASPSAALAPGADGSFYGTTPGSATGSNRGTVFQVTAGGTFGTVYAFTGGTDGAGPDAGVVQAADGTLYGATGSDPLANTATADGTVFSLTTGGTLTTLATFSGATSGAGSTPHTRLALGADGSLYGTTVNGGANGYGTVFSLAVSTSTTPVSPVTPVTPTTTTATVTITVADDGKVAAGGQKGKVKFTRTGDTSTALTVVYKVKSKAVNGTDFAGTDGAALSGTVTIPAGASVYKLKVVGLTVPTASQAIKFTVEVASDAGYTAGEAAKAKLILEGSASESF